MSENLLHIDVAVQIIALAQLSESKCTDFQHHVLNSAVSIAGPGTGTSIFDLLIPGNSAFIVTAIDIKTLYDPADILFTTSDWRSSFDMNPYGPFVAGSNIGQITIFQDNEQQFPLANDIGMLNAGVIFVFTGNHTARFLVNPQLPAGRTLVLISRINGYLVPEAIGVELKKKETRIRTGVILNL